MRKSIASIFRLIKTTADQTTEVVTNLGSAAVHSSAALDILAEDMHNSVIDSTKLNALERKAEHEAAMAKYALPE